MSATRLLVLGVVASYGRAHGYLIHNELASWGAEEWANVKWGSIYHALRQMAKEGKLKAHDMDESSWRVDYEVTQAGHEAFQQLLRKALREPTTRPDTLAAGLIFMTWLTREDVLALLRERLAELVEERDETRPYLTGEGLPQASGTEHLPELFGLWVHAAESGIDWTSGLISRIESGAYVFHGEPGSGDFWFDDDASGERA